MSLLKKRRVLAAKIETTAGTPEALTAAECIFVFDPILQGDIPLTQRNATGSLSKRTGVAGGRKGTMTFSVELAGSGTAGTDPQWATTLLPGCAMIGATHAYSFTSDTANYKTLTLGLYEFTGGTAALVKVLAGAMGTWDLEAESGKPGMLKFSFDGVWQPPVDGTKLALPTYTVIPPRFAAAAFTIGAHTPKIAKFTLGAGNVLKLAEDITTASAYSRCVVTDRDVKGTIDPEAETVASYDTFGDWIAGTERALSLTIGSVAGNTIALAGSHCQIANDQENDRDQLVTNDIDYQLNSTSAGDDEFTLTFS